MDSPLNYLQEWYSAQCNGEWEHDYGIEISTLDNPGWRLKIRLTDTNLENREFADLRVETTDTDWFHCWVEDGFFNAACGPKNLEQVLSSFKSFSND